MHHLPRHEPAAHPIRLRVPRRQRAALCEPRRRSRRSEEVSHGDSARTCKQHYTGAMQTGLTETCWSRVAGQAAESTERLEAENNLAMSLLHQGKDAEAEPMLRRLHEVLMRVLGAEHPKTLTIAGHLASSLSNQGKHVEAERIQRGAWGAKARARGRASGHAD